ncbi:hypothetical protein [Brevinema andersonii]|uniref:hypothetical protein n=1 Tax=Brevinema andersonii TaxID=34097 RepID=UPI00117769BC|nr:hypothetical protein [Brevinema andersonii]
MTEGVFKLSGSGPLSGRIVAIGVDQVFSNSSSTPTGRWFRLYMNPRTADTDTVEKALQELKKLKDAHQFTHDIKQESSLSDSLLTPKTDIWGMLYDPTPSSPNYTEMLYYRKNTSNFIFDASARTVTVKSSTRSINNRESYGYEVMEALAQRSKLCCC